uniref:Beta-defensin-like domain-containing protein n=1 Tax=Terrapene triunguis TaxID=2587831 RepID=A0A674J2E6_9SAUR
AIFKMPTLVTINYFSSTLQSAWGLTGNSHGLYQSKLTVPVSLSFVNRNLSFLFAGIRSSCVARGGQCRYGFCPWKERKIASCGFSRPCCKKVI